MAPPAGAGGASAAKSATTGRTALAAAARKLIRTAEITLQVKNSEQALKQAEGIAQQFGGFVGNSNLTRSDDGSQSANLTVQVPSDRFEQAVERLRGLGEVKRLQSNSQDVTAEYVDLDARIRNAKREEQEILKLYDRKGTLSDIITIEGKLAEVRGQVEQLEGQMRVLREQVDLSTVTLTLAEKSEAGITDTDTSGVGYHLRTAARALVILLRAILTCIIYVVVVGWVFWVPLGLLIWLVRRRVRARPSLPPPPPPPR